MSPKFISSMAITCITMYKSLKGMLSYTVKTDLIISPEREKIAKDGINGKFCNAPFGVIAILD